ncbi:MAG: DUF167 domain-containing protein [Acetobacteraceae bacterium]|nr:DUF167 domain-containing protein [Acetobacteraceae bacterium]
MTGAWSPVPGGLRLALRVTPSAKRDALEGVAADADGRPVLKLRMAAPPVEGAANAALVAFLAKTLGVRKADVTIEAGGASRLKRVRVEGEPDLLARRLTALLR